MLHVLIADDDSSIRGLLATILGTTECTVDLVSNGTEAIRAFADRHYDLVITDLEMPSLSGKELTIAIRQLNATVPVIMLTGHADADVLEPELLRAGVYRLIRKPFRITEILALKTMLLGRPATLETAAELARDFQSRRV